MDEDLIQTKHILSDRDVVCYSGNLFCYVEEIHSKARGDESSSVNESKGRIFFVRTFLFVENKRFNSSRRAKI